MPAPLDPAVPPVTDPPVAGPELAGPELADPEAAALAAFRAARWPTPAVTVDLCVFTVLDADLKLLRVLRDQPPFVGAPALPGGFLRVGDGIDDRGEDLDAAAARVLAEKTGLPKGACHLAQLQAFGSPQRDPRMRVITLAFWAVVPPELAPLVAARGGAAWLSLAVQRPPLAFDHEQILAVALRRLRAEAEAPGVVGRLVPAAFSAPELRGALEAVTGQAIDRGNFHRRFERMLEAGAVEEAPGKRITGRRPAKVYRFTGA